MTAQQPHAGVNPKSKARVISPPNVDRGRCMQGARRGNGTNAAASLGLVLRCGIGTNAAAPLRAASHGWLCRCLAPAPRIRHCRRPAHVRRSIGTNAAASLPRRGFGTATATRKCVLRCGIGTNAAAPLRAAPHAHPRLLHSCISLNLGKM